jgi:glutathione S-transferase
VALPVLYSFRRCPYAIRARLALLQAGQRVELREVDLKHKPDAMLAIAPAATVPVLDLGDGRVLAQSLDIMRWTWQQQDPDGWLARGDASPHRALVDTTDGPFKQALDRYKYAERHPQRHPEDYREDAVQALITPLDAALSTSRFLGGAEPSWVDAAVFPFVRQFATVDARWWSAAPWAATRQWLDGWLTSPLFLQCMSVRHPAWQAGDPPIYCPD